MPGKAGGRNQTLAQRLLSLVGDGPMVGENAALQLVQVGGGKLHDAPGAVPVLVIAPLEIYTRREKKSESNPLYLEWISHRCLLHVFIFLSIHFLSNSEVCVCVCVFA